MKQILRYYGRGTRKERACEVEATAEVSEQFGIARVPTLRKA